MGRDAIEVFYDGACSLCRASRRWAEHRDAAHTLAFCEMNDPAVSPPVGPDRPGDAMQVRLAGGETASGFTGWVAVLGALPRWRLLARMLGFAPARWAGSVVYRFVARHRHALVGG
jgi:predicted DCC family thiol-disulfide oxidoreductase YuxK